MGTAYRWRQPASGGRPALREEEKRERRSERERKSKERGRERKKRGWSPRRPTVVAAAPTSMVRDEAAVIPLFCNI